VPWARSGPGPDPGPFVDSHERTRLGTPALRCSWTQTGPFRRIEESGLPRWRHSQLRLVAVAAARRNQTRPEHRVLGTITAWWPAPSSRSAAQTAGNRRADTEGECASDGHRRTRRVRLVAAPESGAVGVPGRPPVQKLVKRSSRYTPVATTTTATTRPTYRSTRPIVHRDLSACSDTVTTAPPCGNDRRGRRPCSGRTPPPAAARSRTGTHD